MRWAILTLLFILFLVLPVVYFLTQPSEPAPSPPPPPQAGLAPGEKSAEPADGPLPFDDKLIRWGKRGHFPVVRQPKYVSAAEGDRLLAADEPVLGLVHGGQARAWSTNQLNEHEMVIDELAGTPILATY